LLEPQFSEIDSRSNVSTKVELAGLEFNHPIIVANMSSLMSSNMCLEILKSGGLAINHRFQEFDDQLYSYTLMKNEYPEDFVKSHYGISIGIKSEELDNVKKFIDYGGKIINIDVAHADSRMCLSMLKNLRKLSKKIIIIAGSIATPYAAKRMFESGADIVRAGIGAGSICSTRIQTGNGVPSLTMLMDIRESLKSDQYLISDGGLKSSGDIVKSLCFSDMVMAGNLFSGCQETPGKIIVENNISYKMYVGSSTHKVRNVEGVKGLVKTKGKYADILDGLLDGIRSGCSYQNSSNLSELKLKAKFIKITYAARLESLPHSLDKIL
jgi:IMP dehydrogenase